MLICPNKNLKEWKDLAASVGENRAMLMWYESEGKVGFTLSAQTTILDNLSKVNSWFKQMKDTDTFWNKLQKDLQIPKEQISLLKESNGKTIEEKLTNFVINYSYTVEINTAKKQEVLNNKTDGFVLNNKYYIHGFDTNGNQSYEVANIIDSENFQMWEPDTYDEFVEISKEDYLKAREQTGENTQYYSNLTVPGGTNYTENEIATPLITPSIKGHAKFATDNGIGWFRSDEKIDGAEVQEGYDMNEDGSTFPTFIQEGGEPTKTRRILEVQSDLFQKGRDSKVLSKKLEIKKVGDTFLSNGEKFTVTNIDTDSELYELITIQDSQGRTATMRRTQLEKRFDERGEVSSENQFLQLLNKDNNWVTFFIKAVIQDSAKKGYEKVLFPKGETAAKIEGHETMEDEIIRIDKHIDILNNAKLYPINIPAQKAISTPTKWAPEIPAQILYQLDTKSDPTGYLFNTKEEARESVNNKLKILKKERNRYKEEGIEKLKPIEAFYEIKVGNILEKLFGKDNVKVITDEYGNTWNEVELLDDLLENFTIGTFKPRIPIPIPINNSLEELYREDVENSNNTCTFDIGK